MRAKEVRNGGLLQFTPSDSQGEVPKSDLLRNDPPAVELKKHKRCECAGALVAINERVIHDNMKQISCRDGMEVFVEILPCKSDLWLSNGRFEQTTIADTAISTIARY